MQADTPGINKFDDVGGYSSAPQINAWEVAAQWPSIASGSTAAELPQGVYDAVINDNNHQMLFVANRYESASEHGFTLRL